jgi:hypothetical protein
MKLKELPNHRLEAIGAKSAPTPQPDVPRRKSAPRNGPDALRPIRGIFGAGAPQNPRIKLCTHLITGATAHRYQAAPRSSGPLA